MDLASKSVFWMVVVMILLSGCVTPYHENYRIENLEIVFTNDPGKLCNDPMADGCYLPKFNMIVVERGDMVTLAEELCHAIHGDYDHQDACFIPNEPDYSRRIMR